MTITNYAADKIAAYNFGSDDYTPPATLYVGLSTTAIDKDGVGVTEPTDASYARVAVDNDGVTWDIPSDGVLSNLIDIIFPESSESWGIISYVFIADDDGDPAGNVWYYSELSPSKIVQAATIVSFDSGSIVVTVS